MAHIGAATQQRMAEMMEQHDANMVSANKVLKDKQRADEMFMRRFADVIEKHKSGKYGDEGQAA
jgi:hypothetical protein